MAKFEPSILPDVADHPGSFLLEEIEVRGISPDELAAMMGRPAADVHAVVNEQAMISESFARDLERVLGASAQGWLNLCTLYDRILENGGKRASELPSVESSVEHAL